MIFGKPFASLILKKKNNFTQTESGLSGGDFSFLPVSDLACFEAS